MVQSMPIDAARAPLVSSRAQARDPAYARVITQARLRIPFALVRSFIVFAIQDDTP